MTVTLQLPADAEQRLREKAAEHGKTLEAYLQQLIEREARADNRAAGEVALERWTSAWRAWAANHRSLQAQADDSRDSIYGDDDR